MSLMCRSTYIFFQLFLAVVLSLAITGCASTRPTNRPIEALTAPDVEQAVPEFVRNLPKSRTGNMAEYIVFGKRYRVMDSAADFTEQGTASWYGEKFHGRKTSSGDIYDMHAMTAAHKHLPLPTYARVTNLDNNHSVVVKINDRGPFVGNRIVDLSFAAAMELGMTEKGTANVHLEALSTHLVAENEDISNKRVAQSFGQTPIAADTAVPDSLEPEIAAVPSQDAAVIVNQFETEIESLALGDTSVAGDIATPDLFELELADVPSQDAELVINQFESAVEPSAIGELALIADIVGKMDGHDDGFEELGVAADVAENTASVNEQPTQAQVSEAPSVSQTAVGNSSSESDGSYFIQLGAFGHAPNAEALLDEVILKTGMRAFIEMAENQELYLVKLGPFEQGNNLDTAMTELASIGIDGYAKPATMR